MARDLTTAAVFIASLCIGILVFKLAIPLAEKYSLVDVPNSRRRHARPMPIIGGFGVFLTWFAALGLYSMVKPGWLVANWHSLLPIFVSVGILLCLGLMDDLRSLGPRSKLAFQFLAAANIIAFEPGVHAFCLRWQDVVGIVVWPGAIVWLVGLSNAINLVDGIDGLAGGISLLVTSSLVFLTYRWGTFGDTPFILMLMLIPGLMSFLRKNWSPAAIFLGDNGSLPIGLLIGTVSLMCPPTRHSWVHVINIILMMGYPILDMGLATYRRYRKHIPLFKADRNHLHHRLLRLGLSVPQTAVLLLSLTFYLQLTAVCIIDLVRTDEALLRSGLTYLGAIALSMFCQLYLLRGIEHRLTERLAAAAGNNTGELLKDASTRFKLCHVVRIDLDPLYETGLFEEKERVHLIVQSLKLMLQTFTRKEDLIFLAHQKLTIILADGDLNEDALANIEKSIKERLTLFQTVYNLQYSLADLPVSFHREEFLLHASGHARLRKTDDKELSETPPTKESRRKKAA